MTPETEQQLLNALYERLWQAVTYSPGNERVPAFNTETTFLHLAHDTVLYPADFANLLSPANPVGDLKATERFSRMVDSIPEVKADYQPSAACVSTRYRQILTGTDPNGGVDPAQDERYERAYAYLFTDTVTQDYMGKAVTLTNPSPGQQTYERNKLSYLQALANYRTAYLGYDLRNPQQQREWSVNAPLLELAINQAYNQWRREGAAQVEQARAVLETVGNARTTLVIDATLKSLVEEALQTLNNAAFTAIQEGGEPWYLAYPLPANWVTAHGNDGFSYLRVQSTQLNTAENTKFSLHGGGSTWADGLWQVEGVAPAAYHLEANAVELSARLGFVRIYRSWFNGLALKIAQQFTTLLPNETLPPLLLVPTAFLTAHDIRLKGDFTANDRIHLEQSLAGTTKVGLGPVQLSGSYAHSSSTTFFHTTAEQGTFALPGLQILAWISEVMPLNAAAPKL